MSADLTAISGVLARTNHGSERPPLGCSFCEEAAAQLVPLLVQARSEGWDRAVGVFMEEFAGTRDFPEANPFTPVGGAI